MARTPNSRGDFTLVRTSTWDPESQNKKYIERIMHKNFKTIKFEVPISSLQNKFKFMRSCPLSGNESWPILFSSERNVGAIVDDYILKKYAIIDEIN